jgi:hypothetical protein
MLAVLGEVSRFCDGNHSASHCYHGIDRVSIGDVIIHARQIFHRSSLTSGGHDIARLIV